MNHSEAKRHWRKKVAKWTEWAEGVIKEVSAIEDQALKHTVASMLDTCASGFGSVAIKKEMAGTLADSKPRFTFQGLEMDADVRSALKIGLETVAEGRDTDDLLNEGYLWIEKRLKNTDSMAVAFSFGSLKEMPIPTDGRVARRLVYDDVVYDFLEGKVIGVMMDTGRVYRP